MIPFERKLDLNHGWNNGVFSILVIKNNILITMVPMSASVAKEAVKGSDSNQCPKILVMGAVMSS